ncbi:hypothetical protein EYV94_27695 [Puteibacter caeruleilacunae]|nr:hypothetical protein EYV94_27695 [Puteibacter caeruleilacunae]
MRIINIVIFALFFMFLYSCISQKRSFCNKNVFEKKYKCDSLDVPTNDFVEVNDEVYSVMDKEPFDFKFKIVKNSVEINKEVYYYLLGGLNSDTIGLVNITDKFYKYRKSRNSDKSAVLFNFTKKVNHPWVIKEDGYFKDYEVCIMSIEFDEKDTIYSFRCKFLGYQFPNSHYFESFNVSKIYGILSFSLSNGVKCNCDIETPTTIEY